GEKILFAVWQLTRTHTYFVDALGHWSGRSRALLGEVNWSLDPTSPLFLGKNLGNENYPLLTPIWRALSAELNGEWNEVISRADGLIFFIVILGTIWLAVSRFSRLRPLPAAAVLAAAALPLHAWHAAAGYSDIAVEAFAVASLAAILRSEWLTAGLLAAGAAWSKNDALVLYVPSLLAAAALMQIGGETKRIEWRNLLRFLVGLSTIGPWLVFNAIYRLGITPGRGELGWHPDAPGLFWKVITNPSNSLFWLSVLVCAAYSGVTMFRDPTGRALIVAFLGSAAAIIFVFGFTNAYEYMADETTINRVMMQFSSMALLSMTYGLWVKSQAAERLVVQKKRKTGHRTTRSR
ncbi:MAG: hypothetical protein HY646_12990, partial [Acidobacteria bacterium]|nr:hypothetical protein [Acidobacteriota bacterium]